MTDDDDLRERLRRADPAATLASAAPDQVRQLTEETMSRTVTRRWALPVAAALVLLAGGAAWAMTRQEPIEVSPAVGRTVALTSNDVAAKCVAPTATRLSEISDFAVEGTVSTVAGDIVTLNVTRVFRGEPATSVEVQQSADHSEANDKFETGKSYLIAASDGEVLICGYTGSADRLGLRGLYEEAF